MQNLNTIALIIVSIDKNGIVQFINEFGAKLLEYNAKEIIGKNWFENFLPQQVKEQILPLSKLLLSGELTTTSIYPNLIRSKSGKEIPILWKNTLLRDKQGKSIGHFSTGEIIDEKNKQHTGELINFNFLDLISKSDSWLIAAINKDFEYISFNKKYKKTLNLIFENEIKIGEKFSELKNQSKFSEAINKCFLNNKIITEISLQNKENFFLHLDVEFLPLQKIDSTIFGVLILAKDITKEKERKYEIELSNKRLNAHQKISKFKAKNQQDLLDFALSQAIQLTNSKIGYIYKYEEKAQIFTLISQYHENNKDVKPPKNLLLKEKSLLADVVHKNEAIIVNEFDSKLLVYKEKFIEHLNLFRFISVPVTRNGKIVAVVGLANKTNEYTVADKEQLELLMHNVWHLVEKEQLYELIKKEKENAVRANELQTEFLQHMSHEIRTPLNGINGFISLLANDNSSNAEKRKMYYELIQNSSNQLLLIIEDLLEISKIETNQIIIDNTEFALNDLLIKLFTKYETETNRKNIHLYLKKDLNDEYSIIFMDEDKLKRILEVLIENAIKFTQSGYVEYGYKIKNSRIEIYVKDTGIGIVPEKQKIIFERFAQEDGSLTRSVGGLGLGLAIAKEYVSLLEGEINVVSAKNAGATFFVSLPYKPLRINNEETKKTNHKIETQAKILIVDDVETNYLYLEQIILSINNKLSIHYAINGSNALEFIHKNPDTNLIIMDIVMPEMDGNEATQKIKEINPNIPIVVQSAYTTERGNAKIAGCDDFITKPIKYNDFVNLLKKYL